MTDSHKEVARQTSNLEVVQQGYGYGYGYGHPAIAPAAEKPAEKPLQKTVCGLPRIIFWLVVVIALLVIAVVGIAVGLGVGLTWGQNSQPTPAAASTGTSSRTSSVPSSSHSPTTIPPSTTATSDDSSTTKTTSSTTSALVSSVDCPDDDKTTRSMEVGSKTQTYRIHCASDFGGQKADLASVVLSSFDKCLSLCNSMNYFQDRGDVGCTYNWKGTGGQTPGTCWCLGGSDKTVVSNEGNIVAKPV